jgi:GntR family transcriptional regulator
MHIYIDSRGSTPIWEQIVQQVKESIVKKFLAPNDKLPSVRELSSILVVNPNTVSKAYQELERQGVIETIRGRGTFVSAHFEPKADEQQLMMMKESLKKMIIEAKYAGVNQEVLHQWIEEIMQELGGETHAERTKRDENN